MAGGSTISDQTDELIRRAYQIVAEPARLVELQLRIERALGDDPADSARLDAHFAQAGLLFESLADHEVPDFSRFGLDPPRPGGDGREGSHGAPILCLDEMLRVVSVGEGLGANGGGEISRGDDFRDWLAGDLQETGRALRNLVRAEPGAGSVILRFHSGSADQRGTLAVASRHGDETGCEIAIRRVALSWSDETGAQFAESMGLTGTETELVRFLVEGRSVNEFAEARSRAVGTARNQLKSILRKLAVGSQSELISLYAGFASSFAMQQAGIASSTRRACGRAVTLPDGTEILYERYGKPGGTPALLLHGALEGPFLPPRAEHAAAQAGLELLVPWMPFYTGALGDLDAVGRIETFVEKLVAFLDRMEIEECVMIACSLSTAYALALANAFPDRFKGIVLAGMALPMTEIDQDSPINPAWRAPMMLGRRSPRFFELFSRTVFRLALHGQGHHFFDRLFKDSPVDLAILRQPDVAMTMRRSAENRPDRFGAAMAHGFVVMTLDWSRWFTDRTVPVRLVIGGEDTVATPAQLLAFAKRRRIETVGPVDGLGGFSLFQRPELIFAEALSLNEL